MHIAAKLRGAAHLINGSAESVRLNGGFRNIHTVGLPRGVIRHVA